MIIDTHTHIGKMADKHYTAETLIEAMKKYGIDRALVSNLSGAEFDTFHRPCTEKKDTFSVNDEVADLVRSHPRSFRGLFWVRPGEVFSDSIRDYLIANRDVFVGLKIHPYYHMLNVTESAYQPYFDSAQELNFPVIIHTADDEWSYPRYVYEMAKRYPGVDMIMVHMGLYTDHTDAVRCVRELPNLYGDLTWLKRKDVERVVGELDSSKLLFGTDAPIDGVDTYTRYTDVLEFIRGSLSQRDAERILWRNAADIFGLNELL